MEPRAKKNMKIVAEVGINWNGNFKWTQELVRQAASGGADIAKFQLYTSMRVFGDNSRQKYEFTFDDVTRIKAICDALFKQDKAIWREAVEKRWCLPEKERIEISFIFDG